MKFEDLTPEQQEKARACKTPEDILALAKEEGYVLTDDELSAIGGGGDFWHHDSSKDPKCELHCPHV